jgi:energy-coupling factor transport system ATP-binding protein
MWLAAEYAHRTVVMRQGSVVADAPTRAVFSRTAALAEAGIIPPQVVRLSQLLGGAAMTVAELLAALRRS